MSSSSVPGLNEHFKSPYSMGEGKTVLIFTTLMNKCSLFLLNQNTALIILLPFFFLVTFEENAYNQVTLVSLSSKAFKVLGRTSRYGNPFSSHLARVKTTFNWTASWESSEIKGQA